MENIKYKGRYMSVDNFLEEIFGAVPTAKIKITIDSLKKFAAGDMFDDKDTAAFAAVQTSADLYNFILDRNTQNNDVKSFLQACLEGVGVEYKENAVRNCMKNHVKIIFECVFNFGDTAEPVKASELAPKIEAPPAKKIELSFAGMQDILSGCIVGENENLDAAMFNMIENKPVTLSSNFYLNIPAGVDIYRGVVAIVPKNQPRRLAAFGTLKNHKGKTHILLDTHNIDYSIFRGQSNFYVVVFPQAAQEFFEGGKIYSGEVFGVDCTVNLRKLADANATLCIDFGTSNTTVGTYGIKTPNSNEPEIVEFLDETGDTPEMRQMLPTIVYIENCSGARVKYLFGYDALKKVIDNDYTPVATVFYEIKRWITTLDETEDLTDEDGNKAEKISHREIMYAYLEHVIDLAEQYFERRFVKIHFTAPVKLKDSFLTEMYSMFNKDGREVYKPELSIDEGIAIIYNHISEQRKKGRLSAEPKKVLIMDCGGGTTDLASCEYRLDESGYSKKLEIVTKFENGDANFGGNNVTYRILQLLKIKLAARLQGIDDSVQNLIDDENKILSAIDDNHWENTPPKDDRKIIYAKFDAAYEAAERFIPTRFGSEELFKRRGRLKRNFYYLWQMAEAYKIQFYRDMDFVSVKFDDSRDRKIGIPDDDKYYLYIVNPATGELERRLNPMSGIEITNNDIHRLLYADIYSLLKTVLYAYDSHDDEQELLKFNYYKLSGQSCKITLFNELLKEFVPGKYLRSDSGGSKDDKKRRADSSELKLSCIKGSIYYTSDTEFGEIKPHITMETPKLIYDICRVDVDGSVKVVMLDDKIKPVVDVMPSETEHVRWVVYSQNGKSQNIINFDIQKDGARAVTSPQIESNIARHTYDDGGEIARSIVRELRNINLKAEKGAVYALFAVPSRSSYGFYVYCVKVSNGEGADRYALTQEPEYCNFEDNGLATFFDGSK